MSTKTCPYCAEDIREAAIKCRYCGSVLTAPPGVREWHRDLDGNMIAGVCSGLSREFRISATALRIAFVIATFAGGWGLLIYAALWILMPAAPRTTAAAETAAPPPLPPSPGESESADERVEPMASDEPPAVPEPEPEAEPKPKRRSKRKPEPPADEPGEAS